MKELIDYYRKEIYYLREMGREFKKKHLHEARGLELEDHQCADPHVERLIESCAFLTAKIQYQADKLSYNFASHLLSSLYPQLLNPVPSMAIVQFNLDRDIWSGNTDTIIKDTNIFKEIDGIKYKFKTCYDVELLPLCISEASIHPISQMELDVTPNVKGYIKIRLNKIIEPDKDVELKKIRLYLNGDQKMMLSLYELIVCHTSNVLIIPDIHQDEDVPIQLPYYPIATVGKNENDSIVPYPTGAFTPHQQLIEYFSFIEKFLFIDIVNFNKLNKSEFKFNNYFDIFVLLNDFPEDRDQIRVSNNTFRLSCTPVVNLFDKTTEPLELNWKKTEYLLEPDERNNNYTEIHSINSVTDTQYLIETTNYIPFFAKSSSKYHKNKAGSNIYWNTNRKKTIRKDDGMSVSGTDVYISFVNNDIKNTTPQYPTVYAHTLCTNRNQCKYIPTGTVFKSTKPLSVTQNGIKLITKPTSQIDPPLDSDILWQMISNFSLNNLFLQKEGLSLLKDLLYAYNFSDNNESIESIIEMNIESTTARVESLEFSDEFIRGIKITIEFSEKNGRNFILASVLNQFFSSYVSINSFIQLVITCGDKTWKEWTPQIGKNDVI